MADLTAKPTKTTTAIVPSRNLTALDPVLLQNDLELIIFGDHEFPMEHYRAFQSILPDMVDLIITHADAAVRVNQENLVYRIGKHLQEEVGNVVYGAQPPLQEEVEVDVADLMAGVSYDR